MILGFILTTKCILHAVCFVSSNLRSNFFFCSPSSDLPILASRSSSYSNQQTNDLSSKGHLHTATSPFLPDCSAFRGDANHPSANGHSSTASNNSNHQISQLILTSRTDSNVSTSNHLNNQSQYSNEIRLNDRPNKEFATSAHLTPRTMCLQAVRENRFPT